MMEWGQDADLPYNLITVFEKSDLFPSFVGKLWWMGEDVRAPLYLNSYGWNKTMENKFY